MQNTVRRFARLLRSVFRRATSGTSSLSMARSYKPVHRASKHRPAQAHTLISDLNCYSNRVNSINSCCNRVNSI